ncbi:MAG TPA: response regulator transcription factor [Candidatus Sulfotelmatobacter sp.]|jgi:DNA-binding NarL/FixJ family response regulator|nr:response regulator transcription factor [Candidatus Sulfotelmatobacter sp.]
MQRANEQESSISVLVAESCLMSCELLVTALERSRYPISVAASATDSEEVLRQYSSSNPDVCIIGSDLKDGAHSGFGVTRELRSLSPNARVILLLESEQRQSVLEAFRSGAVGVFSREEPFETLCKSVRKVHEGQVWASNRQLHYLVESLTESGTPATEDKGVQLLTKREKELVHLVTEGRTNRDISRELGLSEHTVRNYLFRIFNKLGTSNRLELALYAIHQKSQDRDQLTPDES